MVVVVVVVAVMILIVMVVMISMTQQQQQQWRRRKRGKLHWHAKRPRIQLRGKVHTWLMADSARTDSCSSSTFARACRSAFHS